MAFPVDDKAIKPPCYVYSFRRQTGEHHPVHLSELLDDHEWDLIMWGRRMQLIHRRKLHEILAKLEQMSYQFTWGDEGSRTAA